MSGMEEIITTWYTIPSLYIEIKDKLVEDALIERLVQLEKLDKTRLLVLHRMVPQKDKENLGLT